MKLRQISASLWIVCSIAFASLGGVALAYGPLELSLPFVVFFGILIGLLGGRDRIGCHCEIWEEFIEERSAA